MDTTYPWRCHDDAEDLRRAHPRVPDERARLRAPGRAARDGRLRRRRQPARGRAARRRRRRRLQHLRGARERRQQALRQPRPAAAGQDPRTRTCRSPSAAAWPRRTATPSSSGPPGSTSSSAPTTSAPCRPCSTGRGTTSEAQVEILESLEVFPSTLPTRRDSAYSGWVSISVGCNNTCTFCIVPSLRGKEQDRRPGEILAEVAGARRRRASSRSPCSGRTSTPTASSSATGWRSASCCAPAARSRASSGSASPARTRPPSPTTSSLAMAETPERHAEPAHAAAVGLRPGAQGRCAAPTAARSSSASSTRSASTSRTPRSPPTSSSASPARPRRTSRRRLEVVRESRFSSAFTFQYSIRPGTPAATMDHQVPKAVVQERYERLIALQEEVSWAENRALEGREVEVLVATGEGRKDAETHRLSGRARDNRLVHFAVPEGGRAPRPGDMVTVGVTYGAPHHLVADAALSGGPVCRAAHRRRRRVGRRCRTHQCRASPPCPSGCPRSADPRPSPSRPRPAARGSRLERDCRLEGVQRGSLGSPRRADPVGPCQSGVPALEDCRRMTVRPIVITGEPVLHQRARPVEAFDDDLRTLVADMFETMDRRQRRRAWRHRRSASGCGSSPGRWTTTDGVPERGVVVNPYVTPSKTAAGATRTPTRRPRAACPCRARASRSSAASAPRHRVRRRRQRVSFEATGWFARCMQHEYDHLNGFLYVDRLNDKWGEEGPQGREAQRLGRARSHVDAGRRPRPVRPRLTPGRARPLRTMPQSLPCRSARRSPSSGPTATGKSDLALDLAEALGGEIVNADAIAALPRHGHRHGQAPGRGAPRHPAPPARRPRGHRGGQRRGLPGQRPGRPRRDRRARAPRPCWSAGPASTSVRRSTASRSRPPTWESGARLEEEAAGLGTEALLQRLRHLDPAAASVIEANNARRIVRALEVIELTGRPFSATMPSREYVRPTVTIGLELPPPRPRCADRRARAPDVGPGPARRGPGPGAGGPAPRPHRLEGHRLRPGAGGRSTAT